MWWGNLIRWYRRRARTDHTAGPGSVFAFSFYIMNNQFEDDPHIQSILKWDCITTLRISCSLTNLASQPFFLLNHITTVPENWIAFLGPVPESEMDLMCRNTWRHFFRPFMKPFLEINGQIFCRSMAELESPLSVYVDLQLSNFWGSPLYWNVNLNSSELFCCR